MNLWKSVIRKNLNIVGGLASLASGCLWFLSARAQVSLLDYVSGHPNPVAEKLNFLSQHENLWAAYAAAVAGIAIGASLFFDD